MPNPTPLPPPTTAPQRPTFPRLAPIAALALALALTACGSDDGRGDAMFFVEAEASIGDGVAAGSGDEDIVDGWRLDYDAFTIVIGNLRAARSADAADTLSHPGHTVVNLLDVPAGGLVLHTFKDVKAARWDKVGFDLPVASAEATLAAGVDAKAVAAMVSAGASLHVRGTLSKADGQSCRPGKPSDCAPAKQVRFDWMLAVPTAFDDCAPESGDAGFAVPVGGTAQVKPTVHGDHWLFTNLTQGAELTARRAQWIADADLDRDGVTTLAELAEVKAADAFPASLYNLSGALVPIATARDYLEAQARTIGDFQGDGECPTRTLLTK